MIQNAILFCLIAFMGVFASVVPSWRRVITY